MSSASAASIWQPLQTPSVKRSVRREPGLEEAAHARVEEDRLGPALARAQHVAVAESAAGDESVIAVESRAPVDEVRHVHVDGRESGAVEGRRHLDLAVDALLAQDRDPRPPARRDVGRRDILSAS